MKNFKSKIKQVLAIVLSSTMLLGNANVYAMDSIIVKEEKYDDEEILNNEEDTENAIIEETEIESIDSTESPESINSESEVNESNSTESEEANGNAIISTNSLDEFSNEVAALVSEDVETDSTYATKRLIVLSNISDFDTYNAVSTISYDNLYILSYDTEKDCKKAYKALSGDSTITSVEIDTFMETEGGDDTSDSIITVSNETELKKYLNAITPSKEVKIAILDTGIDTNQFDSNRIIDLGINLSSSGEENSISDDNGHGTDMATIVANNSNEFVKLMPIKVANSDGKATVLNAYLGIQKAMEYDADIINISMNTYKSASSQILTSIIDEATQKGILVVVSAGNNNIDTKNITPANIDSAIVVSAINDDNSFAEYSNYGATVDYCSYGSYNDKTGTSYSAANVTGILADMLSKEQSTSILDQYVIDLGNENNEKLFGKGLICKEFISFEYIDNDEDTSDVLDKDLSITSETLYVDLGDNTFDINSDFRGLSYNSDYYDIELISCTPIFDINTEGDYYATYNFINKENPQKSITASRNITVINDSDFVNNIYNLNISSKTTVAKTGSGTRYTAYCTKAGDYGQEFDSKKHLIPSNARTNLALDSLENCVTQVNAKATTYAKIKAYGESVYQDTYKTKTLPNNVSKLQCTLFYEMCQIYNNGDKKGTNPTKLTNDYLEKIKTSIGNMNKDNKTAYAAHDKTYDEYKKYFETEQLFYTFRDIFNAFDRVLSGDYNVNGKEALTGNGLGYGHKYSNGPNQQNSKYIYYAEKNAEAAGVKATKDNCYVLAVKEDTKNDGSKSRVPILQNIYLYKGDTISFNMSGKSCTHAGVHGKIFRSAASSTTLNYNSSNQTQTVGEITIYNTDETESNAVKFTATKDGYYTFDCTGTAYACKFATIYITTTSSYTIYSTAYDIKYTLNGGTVTGNPTTYTRHSSTITLKNPTKIGYTFTGWTGSNGTTKQKSVSIASGSTGDKTYTANWTPNVYTITLDNQSATTTGTTAYYEKYATGNYSSSACTTAISKITIPKKTGYTFGGYYTATNGRGTQYVDASGNIKSSNTTFTSNTKLYAKWTINTSTLKVNPNGGSWNGSTNVQSFTQNYNTTKSIPIPTKTGYSFIGWTRTNTYGSLSSLTSTATYTYGVTSNVTDTLTANWNINQYTVTYIDVVDSTSGKQLNKTTKQVNYATSVRGSELGSNTADNTYYKGYYYVSDTSATVGVNGATVYRIFKQRMSTVSGNIIWEDWNNKNSSRPDSVTLHINGSDGKTHTFTIKGDNSKNTSTNTWSYNEQVPKYDSNGNVVTYTVTQDKAISKEEGLAYKNPVVNGYDITNSISSDKDNVKPNLNITAYIEWQDNNNQYGFRPTGISLDLLQNGNVIQSINTSSDSYTFEKLYKYDENGNLYKYTVSSNDVDRYNKTIDNEYYTITYTFQAPTYSVIIPKTVVLDGINGIGKYTVSVKGNIDNRDFIKVIPDNSFTMKNDYLSPITATVQQEVTSFTNQNNIKSEAKTIGTITVKSLAGKWSGNFNFNIYFEFGK